MSRPRGRLVRIELVCLNCGNIDTIQRVKCSKGFGHIKDLWCYKCKNVTKHYEIIEKTIFLNLVTFDKLSLYVKSLLENQKEVEEDSKKLILK